VKRTAGFPSGRGYHPAVTRIAVIADDLIWSTRLSAAVERAGATPLRVAAPFAVPAEACDGAIVDLALRAADGLAVVERWHAAGIPVLAVANHDDAALRKRALAAGADKALAYRKLFEDGPAAIAAWLGAASR
jgi:DNA-binding response OmpR family regulator